MQLLMVVAFMYYKMYLYVIFLGRDILNISFVFVCFFCGGLTGGVLVF